MDTILHVVKIKIVLSIEEQWCCVTSLTFSTQIICFHVWIQRCWLESMLHEQVCMRYHKVLKYAREPSSITFVESKFSFTTILKGIMCLFHASVCPWESMQHVIGIYRSKLDRFPPTTYNIKGKKACLRFFPFRVLFYQEQSNFIEQRKHFYWMTLQQT